MKQEKLPSSDSGQSGFFLFRIAICCFITSAFIVSCTGNRQSVNHDLIAEVDSLKNEIRELKKILIEKQDSNAAIEFSAPIADTLQQPTPVKKETPQLPVKEKTETPPKKIAANDTVYHHYSNGKLSVKITPWHEGMRKLFFYNLYGEQTFELEDVRMSYSIVTTLSFHLNGAASKAEISNNPGASRYWYVSTITFSTTNDPLLKYDRTMPPDRIDLEEQKPSFWNKQTRQWVKQEIVKEQPVPEH